MNTALSFQDRARKSGLTAELVRHVVVTFYVKIRCDAVLGPVFEDAVGRQWDAHIERIVHFWLTATRLGHGYDGKNFMPAHLKHRSIQADQMHRWLALFRETAMEQCSSDGALALIDIAERMAENLKIGLTRRNHEGCSPPRGN